MRCPNCGVDTFRITTVCDDDGKPFSFCSVCPRPEQKRIDFPAILSGKRKRGRPPKLKSEEKFNQFKLSDEEIRRTQALAPKVRMVDSIQARQRDSIDNNRETVHVITSPELQSHRVKLLNKAFIKKFGHDNFKIVYDDGRARASAEPLQ